MGRVHPQGQVDKILTLLDNLVASQLRDTWRLSGQCQLSSLTLPILHLSRTCLRPFFSGCGQSSLTSAKFSALYRHLWLFQLVHLAASKPATSEAAFEIVQELVVASGMEGSASEEGAVREVMRAVLLRRDPLKETEVGGEHWGWVERGVSAVGARVAEATPELIVGAARTCEEALPLASMMLECAAREERRCVEAAVDFFVAVSSVAVGERREEFRGEMLRRLAEVLWQNVSRMWQNVAECGGMRQNAAE